MDKYLSTPEEIEQFQNEQLKKEITDLFINTAGTIIEFFKYKREENINEFLTRAFSYALSASSDLKAIKNKCNYEGAFED